MQIDLIKYYLVKDQFIKELDRVLNIKIPKGYKEINATTYQKKNSKDKNTKL